MTRTSRFWLSCFVQSHWRQAGAPRPVWHSPPPEGGGHWRTGRAASAAWAGQWEASAQLCSHLRGNKTTPSHPVCYSQPSQSEVNVNELIKWANVPHKQMPPFYMCLNVLLFTNMYPIKKILWESLCLNGVIPAAPPSAFPRVELIIWTRSITPRSSSVPLQNREQWQH